MRFVISLIIGLQKNVNVLNKIESIVNLYDAHTIVLYLFYIK